MGGLDERHLKAHVHVGLRVMTLCVLLNTSTVHIEALTRLHIHLSATLKSSSEFEMAKPANNNYGCC